MPTDRDLADFISIEVEKPDRLRALHATRHRFESGARYWRALRDAWIMSESVVLDLDLLPDLFGHEPDCAGHFMTMPERRWLEAQGGSLDVFRGGVTQAHFSNALGWSWTVDRDRALWFARRAARSVGGQPTLIEATVMTHDVFGYLDDRGEAEIVVDPGAVLFHGMLDTLHEAAVEIDSASALYYLVQSGNFDAGGVEGRALTLARFGDRYREMATERMHRAALFGLDWLVDRWHDQHLAAEHYLAEHGDQLRKITEEETSKETRP